MSEDLDMKTESSVVFTTPQSVAIDPKLLTLGQASRVSPGRTSTNTIWRWARKGVVARSGERIRLEHLRLGGKIFTTEQWMQDFGRKLATADAAHFDRQLMGPAPNDLPSAGGDESRRAYLEQIDRDLQESGI
jgi:hypothetical protein